MQKSNKITYKQVKEKQTEDLKSKTSRYMIYRKFSTPFTYVFVKLGVSPAAVSILNFITPIAGYFLLSIGTYLFIILGILFFVLAKVLDCSDGEVARIQNPKAMNDLHKSIEGPYFDGVAHFIYSTFLGVGLGMGLSRIYNDELYLTLGVFLTLFFVLERAFIELLISGYRRAIINRKIKYASDKETLTQIMDEMHNGRSWSDGNILSRLAAIYPFQGLIYTTEYIPLILVFLIAIEYSMGNFINFPIFHGITFSIITTYLLIVIIEKSIYYIIFVFKLHKNAYITKVIEKMQNENK